MIFQVSDKKKFKYEACEILKINEFTKVNDCFQNERNEVFGVFLQRLFIKIHLKKYYYFNELPNDSPFTNLKILITFVVFQKV